MKSCAKSSPRNSTSNVACEAQRFFVAGSGYTLDVPFELTLPFSAIVGQEQMKKALLLNAVDPAIGGVLIRGERGTAKASALRAVGRLLPDYNPREGGPLRLESAVPSR